MVVSFGPSLSDGGIRANNDNVPLPFHHARDNDASRGLRRQDYDDQPPPEPPSTAAHHVIPKSPDDRAAASGASERKQYLPSASRAPPQHSHNTRGSSKHRASSASPSSSTSSGAGGPPPPARLMTSHRPVTSGPSGAGGMDSSGNAVVNAGLLPPARLSSSPRKVMTGSRCAAGVMVHTRAAAETKYSSVASSAMYPPQPILRNRAGSLTTAAAMSFDEGTINALIASASTDEGAGDDDYRPVNHRGDHHHFRPSHSLRPRLSVPSWSMDMDDNGVDENNNHGGENYRGGGGGGGGIYRRQQQRGGTNIITPAHRNLMDESQATVFLYPPSSPIAAAAGGGHGSSSGSDASPTKSEEGSRGHSNSGSSSNSGHTEDRSTEEEENVWLPPSSKSKSSKMSLSLSENKAKVASPKREIAPKEQAGRAPTAASKGAPSSPMLSPSLPGNADHSQPQFMRDNGNSSHPPASGASSTATAAARTRQAPLSQSPHSSRPSSSSYYRAPPPPPPLVVDASHSQDSTEFYSPHHHPAGPQDDGPVGGGRVQLVGGGQEWPGVATSTVTPSAAAAGAVSHQREHEQAQQELLPHSPHHSQWTVVSHSHSAESMVGASEEWDPPRQSQQQQPQQQQPQQQQPQQQQPQHRPPSPRRQQQIIPEPIHRPHQLPRHSLPGSGPPPASHPTTPARSNGDIGVNSGNGAWTTSAVTASPYDHPMGRTPPASIPHSFSNSSCPPPAPLPLYTPGGGSSQPYNHPPHSDGGLPPPPSWQPQHPQPPPTTPGGASAASYGGQPPPSPHGALPPHPQQRSSPPLYYSGSSSDECHNHQYHPVPPSAASHEQQKGWYNDGYDYYNGNHRGSSSGGQPSMRSELFSREEDEDTNAHNTTREGGHYEEDEEEEAHPLLKDYNPHREAVRPQFRMVKKEEFIPNSRRDSTRRGRNDHSHRQPRHPESKNVITPNAPARKRRRRQPTEKAAAAAAMAAAAAAAAAATKDFKAKEQQHAAASATTRSGEKNKDTISTDGEKQLKEGGETRSGNHEHGDADVDDVDEPLNLDPGDDEEIPAAKRAAMASAVALRAAAGGSPLEPPRAAAEVDFNIVDPPLTPVLPPSRPHEWVLESASLLSENDVLCGRGGGTNSQMGNRRFRALVRDMQPTYLMAHRREKPLMARSVVLIIRNRRGRFLRRNENDGRLYEVGDEKAEAKASQALREGLDVRATKCAAISLLGSEGSKKRVGGSRSKNQHAPPTPSKEIEDTADRMNKDSRSESVADDYSPARPVKRETMTAAEEELSSDRSRITHAHPPPPKFTSAPSRDEDYDRVHPPPRYPPPTPVAMPRDAVPPPTPPSSSSRYAYGHGTVVAGLPPPTPTQLAYYPPPTLHYDSSYYRGGQPGYGGYEYGHHHPMPPSSPHYPHYPQSMAYPYPPSPYHHPVPAASGPPSGPYRYPYPPPPRTPVASSSSSSPGRGGNSSGRGRRKSGGNSSNKNDDSNNNRQFAMDFSPPRAAAVKKE